MYLENLSLLRVKEGRTVYEGASVVGQWEFLQ